MVDISLDKLDLPALLREAGAIIARPNGWVQYESCTSGYEFDNAPGYCATGAVARVGMKFNDISISRGAIHPHTYTFYARLCDVLNDYLYRSLQADPPVCIPEWNDTIGRTQQEVVALFERAALLCEAETRVVKPEQAVEVQELAYA